MTTPKPQDMMVRYAQDAVSYARDMHSAHLDFSPQSLETLSAIVAKLHAERANPLARLKGSATTRDEAAMISAIFGGYAGEVYRRMHGGEWAIEDVTGACGVLKSDVWIFPVQRIHTHLKLGIQSNYLAPLAPSDLVP